jgi:hypothetical protein
MPKIWNISATTFSRLSPTVRTRNAPKTISRTSTKYLDELELTSSPHQESQLFCDPKVEALSLDFASAKMWENFKAELGLANFVPQSSKKRSNEDLASPSPFSQPPLKKRKSNSSDEYEKEAQ